MWATTLSPVKILFLYAMSEHTTIRLNDQFRWPQGHRVAIIFNIAFEAWSQGQAPGIGPMGNVLKPGFFDTNAHSWASFGANRGIQRLLDFADRRGIKTSVMVNGVLGELAPQMVKAIHERGHEIVNHSWGMDVIPVYFDEAGEVATIEKTHPRLTSVSGVEPCGWISPRGTGSPISPRLLAKRGYLHHGDCNDDDRPYIQQFDGHPIVCIPLTMDVNDLPTTVRYGNAPRHMLEAFEDTLSAMIERENCPLMLDVTAHTHVFGRPSGAWVFDEIMARVQQRTDVWVATRQEMARYVLDQVKLHPEWVQTDAH